MKNSKIVEYGLKIAATGAGIFCIWKGIDMTYQGKPMSIANVPIPAGLVFLIAGLILFGIALHKSTTKIESDPTSSAVWYVLTFLVAVGISLLLSYLLWGRKFIEVPWWRINEYNIFRDLLSIFLAILAGIGLLVFLVLRGRITRSVQVRIGKQFSRISGWLAIVSGNLYFRHKEDDKAIKSTIRALENEKNLRETDVIWAKNNLGYYYAVRHEKEGHPEDKDKAIESTKFGYNKYNKDKENFNRPAWVESYVFARTRFAEGEQEINEVRNLINQLINRKDLQSIKPDLKRAEGYLFRLSLDQWLKALQKK